MEATLQSFPFNAVEGQPAYNADDFRAYFGSIIPENGVIQSPKYPGSLLVTTSGSSAFIAPGAAFINGAGVTQREEDGPIELPVAPVSAGLQRIDLVALRFDLDMRDIYPAIIQGNESIAPVEPEYYRLDSQWDVILASLLVTDSGIAATDTRNSYQDWATVLWKDGIFPLPVTMGGTGANSAAQARSNLHVSPADHRHNAGTDIASGVLPVARGGLGAAISQAGVLVSDGVSFSTASPQSDLPHVFGGSGSSLGFFRPGQMVADQIIAGWNKGVVPDATPSNPIDLGSPGTPTGRRLGPGVYYINMNQYVTPNTNAPGGASILVVTPISVRFGVTEYSGAFYELTRLDYFDKFVAMYVNGWYPWKKVSY